MAQINFKGKSIVWNHHLGVEYHELVPDKNKSLTDKVSLNDNLIIHGDNLKALKALLPTYAGKVKCIYIDPPYNTGNEGWAYNDNVSSPMMKEWLGKTVDHEDLTRHDKWLCMMTPRLKLLRELLSSDGAIFVSIDDNEQHHLRDLMDEIFGEENFVAALPRVTKKAGKSTVGVAKNHDYVFIYANSIEEIGLVNSPHADDGYKHRDEYFDTRGPYKLNQALDYDTLGYVNSLDFPIDFEGKVFYAGSVRPEDYKLRKKNNPKDGFRWRWSPAKVEFGIKNGWLQKNKTGTRLYTKTYANAQVTKRSKNDYFIEYIDRTTPLSSLSLVDNKFSNDNAKKELEKILGKSKFDYPKPSLLVQSLLELFNDKDAIVLDSFSGTGTTAHATLALNEKDDGNRKFILIEMEDYADTLTAERVRRVINGVPTAKEENLKKGLGGSFSYFSLGDAIDEIDILSGKHLPSYEQMARYLFYTATGEEFDEKAIDESKNFIGKSKDYEVYLFYKPDVDYLKNTALNLDRAKALPAFKGKKRLIFAPAKYLDQDHLDKYHIDFAQLPFEIYRKGN